MLPSRWLWVVLLPGALLAACNAIWGIEEPSASPDGGADAGRDGTSLPDAGADGSQTEDARDGASDVHPTDAPGDAPGDTSRSFNGTCPDGSGMVALATSQPNPSFLAADEAGVYWTTIGSLEVLRFGFAPISAFGNDAGFTSQGVAVSNGSIVWATGGETLKCPAADCKTDVHVLTHLPPPDPYYVAANATTAYWATFNGGVESCALGGCDGSPTVLVPTSEPVSGLALDSAYFYWSDGSGFVYSCPLEGCEAGTNVVVTTNSPTHLAIRAGTLFWSSQIADAIGECTLKDGACVLLSPTFISNVNPAELAVDDHYVYWIDGSGFVGRASLDGGAPDGGGVVELYKGTAFGGLAVGDRCVFWTLDDLDGAVFAGPK